MKIKKTASLFILIAIIAVTSCVRKYNGESDFRVERKESGIIITRYLDSKQKKVRIPPRIQNLPVIGIGERAFESSKLTGVTIPSSVTSIGDRAFINCKSLTKIKVAADNTAYTAEKGVLYNKNKTSLHTYPAGRTDVSFTIPNTVTSIGDYAFSGFNLPSITIPNSVTSIGYGAFSGCKSLTSVTIPDSVTNIGGGAFYQCDSLASITIGNSVTSIGKNAFYFCKSLKNITIKTNKVTNAQYNNWGTRFSSASSLVVTFKDVTAIDDYAFSDCRRLASVTIPNSVTSIGREAFSGFNLPSITIPDSVTSIGDYAFSGSINLADITIPNSVISIGNAAFYNSAKLTEIRVAAGNSAYVAEDGILYNKNKTLLHTYPAGKTDVSFTIPNSVKTIGERAFYYCTSLASVTIPDSVTSIGKSAFQECTFTSVTIPDSVTNIGKSAFQECAGFTSITIPNNVTNIEDGVFKGCINLTSITIPDSVTSIGEKTFQDCASLIGVIIPNNVTSIGDSAFYGCISLTSVTFQGTIPSKRFNWSFNGDLRDKFYAADEANGTPGTYTRERDEGSTWTRQ